jgi:sugar-specific transcriptional regulator TrmB
MTFSSQNTDDFIFSRFAGGRTAKGSRQEIDEKAFVSQLAEFGLKEKESRIYFYLLRNGPKSVTDMSKFVKTYREDVYRRLDELIQEGLVEQSIEKPSKYAAVPLRAALDVILQKHTYAKRQMEKVRDELLQKADTAQFGGAAVDEIPGCRLVKGEHEILATGSRMIAESESSICLVVRPTILPKLAHYGIIEEYKEAALRGVVVRIVTDAVPTNLATLTELMGVTRVRCRRDYTGMFFWVADNKETVTLLATAGARASLANSAFWTDSAEYAGYTTSFFDLLWGRSVAAEDRIRAVFPLGE